MPASAVLPETCSNRITPEIWFACIILLTRLNRSDEMSLKEAAPNTDILLTQTETVYVYSCKPKFSVNGMKWTILGASYFLC